MLSLALRNLLFSIVVPGSAAVLVPWWILTRGGATSAPMERPAVAVIAVGAVLYLVCVWVFAVVSRRTPGPWEKIPLRLFMIRIGNHLVALSIAGAILAVCR